MKTTSRLAGKLPRRDFIKACVKATALMGLPASLSSRVEAAAQTAARPTVNRSVPMAQAGSSPMATRTWEMSTVSAWQAAPAETATYKA